MNNNEVIREKPAEAQHILQDAHVNTLAKQALQFHLREDTCHLHNRDLHIWSASDWLEEARWSHMLTMPTEAGPQQVHAISALECVKW